MPAGPQWPDLLRYAPGTRLRLEVALPDAMRQALEAVKPSSAARWLGLVDGALLTVERLSRTACQVSLAGRHGGRGEFSAVCSGERGYRLRGRLDQDGCMRILDCDHVHIQTGGAGDAYLAQPVDGSWRHLLRLSYPKRAAGAAEVVLCAAALGGRVTPALQALLPAQLLVARLLPQA
ncbi:hypothetical protein WQ53_08510 [Pseudoxanthomonas suwonensis]|uniref:Uncharacterized protein n=2 Tax=Pseudoxanthomonas suwonensis TaxID=314722 RepID=A0A0E3Z3M5_9GAMM|nr:hypothetical protein WQ53_08510 [Pseudoxanthomonas suwonensis]